MGAITVVNGKLATEPTIQVLGTEEKPVYAVSLAVRSTRYDFINRKQVADMYTVQVHGNMARKLYEKEQEGDLNALTKDDHVVAYCETQLHASGPVFFAKEVRLLGHEGFELHIVAGAVESGRWGEVEREDREDGHWAAARVRVPSEKWDNPEEVSNRHYNLSAWDGRAKNLGKHIIPDEDDKDAKRRWVFVAGHAKTEKRTWENDEGEEITRYETKTEVNVLEFTKVATDPYEYGTRTEQGGSGGDVDADTTAALAQQAAAAEAAAAQELEDEDIPF